jgi:hypothetical protein
LARIEDFTGHPIERQVLEVLLGVVPAAEHVLEATPGGERLGGIEPCAGVRDEADPGEDLIRLDDDMAAAVDPLDPRRTFAERRINRRLVAFASDAKRISSLSVFQYRSRWSSGKTAPAFRVWIAMLLRTSRTTERSRSLPIRKLL